MRSVYSESDKNINLIKNLNAFIKSAERPPGVVIKYRQLINEVERDKRTLIELENNLLMSLEGARVQDHTDTLLTLFLHFLFKFYNFLYFLVE